MVENTYESGTSVQFDALHLLPGKPLPESILHVHHFRVDIVITNNQLDPVDYVIDLDVLDTSLQIVVEQLEGRDLNQVLAIDVAQTLSLERLAAWIHARLVATLPLLPHAWLHVRAWESPVAFGGYMGLIR